MAESQIPSEPVQSPERDMQSLPTSDDLRKKRSWRTKTLLWTAIVFLVIALLIAITAMRLFLSPVSISALVDEIEHNAAAMLPPGQILQLDDALVGISEGGRVALRLTNVALLEGDKTLLAAPRIDLEVRPLDLLNKTIRPSQVIVNNMKASVARDANGRFLIAGQDPGAIDEAMGPPTRSQAVFYDPDEPEFVSLIYSMRRAIQPLADDDHSKRPPRIFIKDTEIVFDDAITGSSRSYNNVAFSYNPTGDHDNLWRIDFAMDGHHGRIGFAMAEFPLSKEERGVDGRSIEFRFADVSLPDFVPRIAKNDHSFSFSSPFYGAARLDFDLKGVLVDMRLALDVGAGTLDFGGEDTALLDEAAFRFNWDPEIRALSLSHGAVHFGETGGDFRGFAVWPETRDGDVRIALEGFDFNLAARDNPHTPKKLKQLLLQAKVGRESGIATIERFAMIAEGGSVQGAGSLAMVDGELTTGMSFVVSEMSYDLLTQMWPISVANGARKWIIKNITAGKTTGADIEVALTESMLKRNEEGRMKLPDDSIRVNFGVAGVGIKGFGDLPPVEGLDGSGLVTGRTMISTITDGVFVTKKGRKFPINSGKFEIPDHSEKPATGVVVVDASGSASALGEIVDSEPLHVLRSEDQKPEFLKGKANAKVRVSFPFVKELKKEQVDYSAKISLDDFSSSSAIRGRQIDKADLVVSTDGTRIDIKGGGRIDGLETNLDLVTSTDDSISLSSKFELVLSEDDRKKLGIDIGQWLKGPVSVRVAQSGKNDGVSKVEVDLTRAGLIIDEIGWSKKANVRGKATFDLVDKGGSVTVRNAKISGDGFNATGSAEIDKKSGLKRLTIADLQLSRGDRLKLDAVQSKPKFYTIRLGGELLDLRGKLLSGSFAAPSKSTSKESFVLNANLKRVIGLSGHTVSDVVANFHVVNGKEKSIKVRGLLDGRSQLNVDTKAGDKPTVHVSSSDAGALFRFFGALDSVLGGRLALSVTLKDSWNDISGSIFLKDFNLSGLVQKETSRNNDAKRVNSNFNKFTGTYTGKNGVYNISNGILKGAVLGATVKGTVDMRSKNLSLAGTYIPAYGVNNFFSRLPVLGRALGNRKNEGLLGITYKIKGDMSNPKILINPASLLAPGALRKIFEFN